MSITFWGKDISTITFCACNAVWMTTIHNTRENYQEGWNYSTIKSNSDVSGISAAKCKHILFDITSICHENKCPHVKYSGDPGFPFLLKKKKEKTNRKTKQNKNIKKAKKHPNKKGKTKQTTNQTYKCSISKENGRFTPVQGKNFSTYFASLLQN